jgi:hypothetical protein
MESARLGRPLIIVALLPVLATLPHIASSVSAQPFHYLTTLRVKSTTGHGGRPMEKRSFSAVVTFPPDALEARRVASGSSSQFHPMEDRRLSFWKLTGFR